MMTGDRPRTLFTLLTLAWWASSHVQADEAWRPAEGPLMTRWAKDVSPDRVLPEYPRPQMERPRWLNLNGLWDYAVTAKAEAKAPANYQGQILVPFPIESALSGVMKPLTPAQRLWYRRSFEVPKDWIGQRVLLHFGAVDWEAAVSVNGKAVGSHRGGYDAFEFDITKALKGDGPQEVVVSVLDPTSEGWQLRGKQSLHPAGAFYTASSGIWQTAWLEPVPHSSIEGLKMVADSKAGSLRLTVSGRTKPEPMTVSATAFDGDRPIATVSGTINAEVGPEVAKNLDWYKATSTWGSGDLDLLIPDAKLWTPDRPFLYDLTIELKDKDGRVLDSVRSYCGLRTIAVGHDEKGNTRPMLNGRPIMLPGALDQGFWPDGIYTAPTDEALRFDIEAARRLGLAAVRKHIKVEPDRYYYWADRLGLLILQDLPSGSEGDPYTDRPTSPEASSQCEMEKRLLIQQRWNHPSIICWVMFNEGWGQHDTLRYASWAKQLDPSRLIDEASGFPRHGGGDVLDCHGGIPPRDPRRISLDSETGGYGLAAPGHSWPGKPWATGTYNPRTDGEGPGALYPVDEDSKAWYTRQLKRFYRAMWAGKDETGGSGDFKVQLYDVETESNGFLSYDRAVWKVAPEVIAPACRGEMSRKDVVDLVPCTLTAPTTWRFSTTRPPEDWTSRTFDDSAWKEGRSGFGAATGGGKSGTAWQTADIWLRKEFDLDRLPSAPALRMAHDEDVEVYLNGVPAAREGGFTSSYDDYEIRPGARATLAKGKNVIAVHCRQTTGGQFVDVGLVDGPEAADEPARFSYSNPIYFQGGTSRDEVRDPCIIREGDTYYLVFTVWPFRNREESHLADPDQGSSPGIRLFSSKDLKGWKFEKWLVKAADLPEDCPYKNRFWAPEIHKIGGKFYLIFTADNWIKKSYNPAGTWGSAGYAFVGVADRVDGPYEHITYIKGGACDTTLFEDKDGKTYAFIPRGNVDVQEIDLSRLDEGRVTLVGRPKMVVSASNKDVGLEASPEYLEGPWVERIGEKYFLFYAEIYKDRKFPDFLGYHAGVAYADHPLGPWKKDERGKVFHGGHLAVFPGPDGRRWFSYREEKYPEKRGFLCIDPFDVDQDGRVQAEATLGPRSIPIPAR